MWGKKAQIQHINTLIAGYGQGGVVKGLEVHRGLYLERKHPGQVQQQAEQAENEPGDKSAGETNIYQKFFQLCPKDPETEEKRPAARNSRI